MTKIKFGSEESKKRLYKEALEILEQENIILDKNTLFGKFNFKHHHDEMINELHAMGYEGELHYFGDFFAFPGEITAIYDTNHFEDRSEVKQYIQIFIKQNYKEEF